jgi:hypothetical protein
MKLSLLALAGALALGTLSAQASSPTPTSWEVAGEFNDVTAAGPVWSYGSKYNGAFTAFSMLPTSTLCLTGFMSSLPAVFHNPAMTSCTDNGLTYAPRALVLHPGVNGEAGTVRFKAPYAALYRISGQFYGVDGNGYGTHTAVSIVATNVINQSWSLYAGSIALPNVVQASFTSKPVMLRANETIDFLVNAGPNNDYFYGSTGLHAVIERAGPWCGPTNPNQPWTTTC